MARHGRNCAPSLDQLPRENKGVGFGVHDAALPVVIFLSVVSVARRQLTVQVRLQETLAALVTAVDLDLRDDFVLFLLVVIVVLLD